MFFGSATRRTSDRPEIGQDAEKAWHRGALLVGSAAVALVFAWQATTVHFNYGGNWSSLFYIGDRFPLPPELAGEGIWVFRNNPGYDGVFYHLVAHDPWFRRGFIRFADNSSLRWRRILIPALANLGALGKDSQIHAWYIGVNLLFVFVGAGWLARFFALHRLHSAWGLCFIAVPSVLVSMDRLTIDTALAALTVGFIVYATAGQFAASFGVLALCPLARETGLCMIAGKVLTDLRDRNWRKALIAVASALPFVAWAGFVFAHAMRDGTHWLSWPLAGIGRRTLNPVIYPITGPWTATAAVLDYLAVIGIWVALILTVRLAPQRRFGLIESCACVFAFAAVWLGKADIWAGAYEFGRTMSPLLILLGLAAVRDRKPYYALPLVMTLPRILLQFEPQLRGILKY